MRLLRSRPATTLLELMIFMAILGMVISITIPLLFSATENRLLQTTISIVEQNGAQILGNVSARIRSGEKIIRPAAGSTGSVLVLQTASGATDPIIIGMNSGSLVIIEHLMREDISTEQVAITDFVVRNTSTSATRQSVSISFTVSRTIRLQMPRSYVRSFETTVSLLPSDVVVGNPCGCVAPACNPNNEYMWEVCEVDECILVETALECP